MNDKIHICSICSKRYSSISSLSNHTRIKHNIRKHNTIKIHICRYCNKEFGYQQSKWLHEQSCKIKNEEKEKNIIECKIKEKQEEKEREKEKLEFRLKEKQQEYELKLKEKKELIEFRFQLQMQNALNNKLQNSLNNESTNSSNNETMKVKKKTIPSAIKRIVWNINIGEEIGKSKCYCCKLSDITQLTFHCGHVISEKNGGSIDVENLKPICQNCNSSMGTTNMDEFMEKYKIQSTIC